MLVVGRWPAAAALLCEHAQPVSLTRKACGCFMEIKAAGHSGLGTCHVRSELSNGQEDCNGSAAGSCGDRPLPETPSPASVLAASAAHAAGSCILHRCLTMRSIVQGCWPSLLGPFCCCWRSECSIYGNAA